MSTRWRRLAAAGMVLLLPTGVLAFEDLGLRWIPDDPARPLETLDMSERLSRIDALEHELEVVGVLPDSSLLELGRLYASSSLMKHRVQAFEFDGALADPTALEALRHRAHRLGRVWNPWDAQDLFDEMIERHPHAALAHRERGAFLLEKGLHTLDEIVLRQALESFRRAVACVDAGYEDRLGLASALLATNERRELTVVGEELMNDPRGAIAGRLYAAVGYRARDLEYSAEQLFRDAISRMSTRTQSRFRDLEGFLAQFQPILLHESALQTLAPKRLLGWWERLTECEVLFGQPLTGVHGWDTAPGQVYLTFGRPHRHYYFGPFQGYTVEEVDAFTRVADYRSDLLTSLLEIGKGDGTWVWFLKPGDAEIPYVFRKAAAFARWQSTVYSHTKFAQPLAGAMPLALNQPPPVARLPQAELRLGARHATFVSAPDRVRAESYLSIQPVDVEPGVELTASLVILDQRNQVVERVSHPVDLADDRADMLARIPGTSGEVSGAVTGFGASLAPGRYLFRLEVESAEGGLYAATDQAFWLRGRPRGFGMSDLLLADSFAEYSPSMQLPAHFVKYARAVMPHPEYRAHAQQSHIYVYYEVYGAEVDERGNAHLDTLYEIFPRADFDPLDAGRPEGQGGQPVERVRFPTESIGRSAEGVVVKGTMVDLTDLAPGEYVLAVRVTDGLARHEAQRYVPFGR